MQTLFAVIRSRGEAWDESRPLEQQPEWRRHAEFMDALHETGFVVLGGPLEGTASTLLIVRARDEEEIRLRLNGDPWSDGMLKVAQVAPWTLRLGSLSSDRGDRP